MNIITENGKLSIRNEVGLKLEIYQSEENRYGFGTIFLNGVQIGGCEKSFLHEDNHYVWDNYQAVKYEIVENTEDKGVIRFYGTCNVIEKTAEEWTQNNISSNWIFTIELGRLSHAFKLNMQVEPYLWPGRYHPIYFSAPFYSDMMECVSYPMEAPVLPPYTGHWTITPDIGKVPLMLARERVDGKTINVGIGYTLDYEGQDYTQGALWYDTVNQDRALRLDFPYRHYPIPAQPSWDKAIYGLEPELGLFKHGKPYTCDMILAVASSQAECVWGYRDACGFNSDTVVKHDVMKAVNKMMNGYNTNVPTIYVKGKGYRMRAWADSDEIANYYAFITFQSNALLCYLLYLTWCQDNTQTWAKERMIEMTEFAISKQSASGAMPRCWDVDNDIPHGMGDNYQEAGYVYDMMSTGVCAQYTDMICTLMQQRGEAVPDGWRNYIERCTDWIVRVVNKENGFVRGTYNSEDRGVMNGIEAHCLFALRYFWKKTGEARYLDAMKLYENSIQERFGINNDWYDGILDSNNLRPPYEGEQPRNYYTLNLLNLAGYYHDRYLDSGEKKYLDWAEDTFAFGWMGRMPVNMPGYDMQTKGVIEEQNVWVFYDLPWPFNSSSGLARMALTTKNPFYAEYYKLAVNTQLEFAHLDKEHPFCSQVLGTCEDKRAPANRFAEIVNGKHGIWLTGYSTLFIYDMLADYSYYYLGGKDWGVGIDNEPDYNPLDNESEYIAACRGRLVWAGWNDGILEATIEGNPGDEGKIVLCGNAKKIRKITVNGTEKEPKFTYDERLSHITLYYSQLDEKTEVKIIL